MIRVTHLTKTFGRTVAVDNVSFHVRKGEIVAFLGPNGAGKTTTMRILSGYLPATGGSVKIDGLDVLHDSLEVRRCIGYLPESAPLYPEMRVDEYLTFRGRLQGLRGRHLRNRLTEVKELCWLGDYGRKLIGTLSRGYCQRVGLADALIHEPELLILDEPTFGLDPHQIRNVRELILNLAGKHTIFLSTHILTEAEKMCQRVLIINKGRIVASDTPNGLHEQLQGSKRVKLELSGPHDEILESLNKQPNIKTVQVEGEGEWRTYLLTPMTDIDLRKSVYGFVASKGWLLRELKFERNSKLEDIFFHITNHNKYEGIK